MLPEAASSAGWWLPAYRVVLDCRALGKRLDCRLDSSPPLVAGLQVLSATPLIRFCITLMQMPPKKKADETKVKPILGRFKSNLKVSEEQQRHGVPLQLLRAPELQRRHASREA